MSIKLFVFAALLFPSLVHAGDERGNGGDLVAQEFIAAGRRIVLELKAKPDPRIPDLEKLSEAVERVKVSSAETLSLHGNEVDAINFPDDKHIDVSRSRWRDYGPGKRASLVLHEYLGVLDVEDKHYEISGSYADAFSAPAEEPKKIELSLSTAYAAGITVAGSWSPGVGLFFGYKLSPRSTLGLKFDSRLHGYGAERERYTEIALSYKYWLALGRKWSPYTQASVGYVRTSPSELVTTPGWSQTERTHEKRGDLNLQLGGGYRYSLLRDVGLDLGLHLDNVGAKLNGTFLVGTVGVDLVF